MALDEKISGLIGRIYESVDDPNRWEGVLLELKDVFEACMILETLADLRHRELSRSSFLGRGGPQFEERIAEFRAGHYKNDPTFQFATLNPQARFCARKMSSRRKIIWTIRLSNGTRQVWDPPIGWWASPHLRTS